ncbi:MAG: DUF3298 and DUF4163 domain-containing protein [Tannerellaceae bacterium]|jgi:hypothetical protein|nr:DUF3298 and DUF4163 domain-containing protein [Tannerellaceae bacterium]
MKKDLYGVFLVVFLALAATTGCRREGSATGENPISWDSVHVEKTLHLLGDPQNPHCNLQIRFRFPTRCEKPALLETLSREFITHTLGEAYENLPPEQAVERYAETYLAEYVTLEEDFLEELDHDREALPHSWFSYYEYLHNEVVYNRNLLLCYAVSLENYTGGAHGAHTLTYHVIDLETGLPLTESDIFIDGYQDELAAILVRKIAESNGLENPEDLENRGYFSIKEIYPNNNFALGDEGITYCFNEYEIAAYVTGATRVFLPYREIRHLLRRDTRLARLGGHS